MEEKFLKPLEIALGDTKHTYCGKAGEHMLKILKKQIKFVKKLKESRKTDDKNSGKMKTDQKNSGKTEL